jgi:hypothetical protein
MKQIFQSPMFKVVLLAVYVAALINRLKGISHLYTSNAISVHSSADAGFNWGYRAGYMASIAVWMIGITLMIVKLTKGKPAFGFIKH